jgi:hypothetical protein
VAKMRFEFDATNVSTLVDMIYLSVAWYSDNTNVGIPRSLLKNLKRMANKVKMYGLNAFETREMYRTTIKKLLDFLDEEETKKSE